MADITVVGLVWAPDVSRYKRHRKPADWPQRMLLKFKMEMEA